MEGRVESVFSDSDPSDVSTVGEVPEKSVPSKKHPALPFPEGQLGLDSSNDSNYEMDNRASLKQCPVRKLPARKSHPVGSLAEK